MSPSEKITILDIYYTIKWLTTCDKKFELHVQGELLYTEKKTWRQILSVLSETLPRQPA